MPDLVTNTHSMLVAAAGQAAIGEAVIGQITLPAGGPWIIHDVFGQIVSATATPAEVVGGFYRFDVASGDIVPNPAPSRFPTREMSSALGATINRGLSPLNLFSVAWEAAGKAVINLIGNNNAAVTEPPQWIIGLIFGKSRPEIRPAVFCDRVMANVAVAADAAVGVITLSEKATRITGICGVLNQGGVLVTAEELLGFFRLTSDDVTLPPMQLPFNCAYGAGLGALINTASEPPIKFIPVDIPVYGGARITVNVDLNTAVTNPANVDVYIAYE